MKKTLRILFTSLKWLIALVIMVEVASFLAVSISNYWIYGQLRDGDPVHYDPYALFLEGDAAHVTNNPAPGKSVQHLLAIRRLHHARGLPTMMTAPFPAIWPRSGTGRSRASRPPWSIAGEDGFNSIMETKYLQKRTH